MTIMKSIGPTCGRRANRRLTAGFRPGISAENSMRNNVYRSDFSLFRRGVIRFFVAAAALLACAVLALGAVRVCPKCGHEADEADAVCSHCSARLSLDDKPEAPEPQPGGNTFRDDGRLDRLDPKIVDAEIDEGIRIGEGGDADVAYYFFRNAVALQLLVDPAKDEGRTARIVALIQRCGERGGAVRHVCRDCGGTGRAKLTVTTTRRETIDREAPSRLCASCDGKGYFLGYGSIDERKFHIGQAWNRYKAAQMARLYAPVGNAFVTRAVEGKLDVLQATSLKKATVDPCRECAGIGRIQCRYCNGKGFVPCTNTKCKDGKVRETRRTELSKTSISEMKTCMVCDGRGVLKCRNCDGKGCNLCKSCGGSGAAPACSRCGSQGWYECSRCRGAGAVDGERCAACKGEGKIECSSCGGDGRK